MTDMSRARRAMVDSQLRPQGVSDKAVLAAMGSVERERFVPEAARPAAYFDRPVRIGEGRTMMPPAALGLLLTHLAPQAGERALVVGSGGGYSAAVLQAMGVDTVAVEQDAALVDLSRAAGVEPVVADPAAGAPATGPYDIILIDGAVEHVPASLVKQLSEAGRLGVAMIERGVSRLAVGRVSGGDLGLAFIVDADVSLLPGFAKPRAFSF